MISSGSGRSVSFAIYYYDCHYYFFISVRDCFGQTRIWYIDTICGMRHDPIRSIPAGSINTKPKPPTIAATSGGKTRRPMANRNIPNEKKKKIKLKQRRTPYKNVLHALCSMVREVNATLINSIFSILYFYLYSQHNFKMYAIVPCDSEIRNGIWRYGESDSPFHNNYCNVAAKKSV